MQTRKFDEMISYFNRKVAGMDIDINYKMELLGMVTALGCAHEKELNNPITERTGKWLRVPCKFVTSRSYVYQCDKCEKASYFASEFCPNCGAKMEEPEDIPVEYFESGGG